MPSGPSTPAASADDYTNPWESAANDQSYNSHHTNHNTPDGASSTMAFLNGDSNFATPTATQTQTPSTSRSCYFQCFQACHVMDLMASVAVLLYSGLVWWESDRPVAILGLALGSVWMIRGVAAKIASCGVVLSKQLSSVLCVVYGLTGLVGGVVYLLQDGASLLPLAWCEHHPRALPCFLLALSVLEGARYVWIHQWMLAEASMERDALNASEISSSTRSRPQSSPWWWNSNSNSNSNSTYRDPLLSRPSRSGRGGGGGGRPHWTEGSSQEYYQDDGVGSPRGGRTGWWPFGRRGAGRNDAEDRDDASVEYASLNEDWASRSQEDPFWWTQEGGGGGTVL